MAKELFACTYTTLLHTVLNLDLHGHFAALTERIKSLIGRGHYDEAANLVGNAGLDGLRKELLIGLTVKMAMDVPKPKPKPKPKGLKELFNLDSMIRFAGLCDNKFNFSLLNNQESRAFLQKFNALSA